MEDLGKIYNVKYRNIKEMLCQICKKRKAGIIFYRIINGKKTEIHICEECVALFTNKLPSLTLSQFNINDLLIGLLSAIDFYGKDEDVIINKELKCANCSLTYEEFRQTGKLGCSQCYQYFKNKLKPLLTKLHGNYHHNGKISHSNKGMMNKLSEVFRLKKELNEAVCREEYEKAAKIRDKIIRYERSKKPTDD